MVLSSCTVFPQSAVPGLKFLLTNISSSSSIACGISQMEKPLTEDFKLSEQGTVGVSSGF